LDLRGEADSYWFREIAAPVRVLAIDDLRLLGMQHQLAGRKAVGKCAS